MRDALELFLLTNYEWFRAFHILSVIAWMAGLLYLPRLFVHHVSAVEGGELAINLAEQERKLLRRIMNPAMIAVWVFGILMLLARPQMLSLPWMHVKLVLIVFMTGAHHYYAAARKKFAAGTNTRTARFWRMVNEVPALLAIGIVICAVVQPGPN